MFAFGSLYITVSVYFIIIILLFIFVKKTRSLNKNR